MPAVSLSIMPKTPTTVPAGAFDTIELPVSVIPVIGGGPLALGCPPWRTIAQAAVADAVAIRADVKERRENFARSMFSMPARSRRYR